jgi:hypothetical protein
MLPAPLVPDGHTIRQDTGPSRRSRRRDPHTGYQPGRERVRHGPASNCQSQGRDVARHRPADGVQAHHGRRQDLAPVERRKSVAQGHPGHQVHRWRRGHQHVNTERRLITPSPSFPHSSRFARPPLKSQWPHTHTADLAGSLRFRTGAVFHLAQLRRFAAQFRENRRKAGRNCMNSRALSVGPRL